MMTRTLTIALLLGLTVSAAARADNKAEAADAARGANCTPAKTEVLRYRSGDPGETVYRITCQENKDVFIHVQCRGRVCVVLRPPTEFSIR